MKPETFPSIPLPPEFNNPPPVLLTFGEAVSMLEFWNLGSDKYLRELRDLGVIKSANEFPHGQRARYWADDVLKLYPAKKETPQPTNNTL